jgi:hypothetical protein
MSKGTAPVILNLDNRRRCSTSLPGRITPGKETPAPIEWEMGMPDSWCERFWRQENLFPLPVLEPRTIQPKANCYSSSKESLFRS